MTVRSLAIGAIASTALFAGGALAADLPARAPVPVYVASVYNWSGFYLGVNAGYAWRNAKTSVAPGDKWVGDADWIYYSPISPGVVNIASQKMETGGFTGGAQFGFNYQLNNLVFGIEADVNFLNLNKSTSNGDYSGVDANYLAYSDPTPV